MKQASFMNSMIFAIFFEKVAEIIFKATIDNPKRVGNAILGTFDLVLWFS